MAAFRKLNAVSTLCLILVYTIMPVPAAQAQVVHAADLGGLLIVLGQLRQSLDDVINTVDSESAARINQLKIAVDSTISEVDKVIKDGFDKAQTTETKLFSDVNNVIERTNHELESKGFLAYIGVNSTLVNVATTLEGVPFVKVKPYLFATSPLRLSPDATDRLISFYGHFPDIDKSHPATVEVEMAGVGKKRLNLAKYVGNQLGFQLPGEYVKEGQFLEMLVSIPTVKYYVWHTTEDIRARMYVERRDVFSFDIKAFQENPALWATIVAPSERHERADSNRTSNSQTLTAKELFSTLVNDDTTYDMSSATFVTVGHRESQSVPPCHCGCNGGNATFSSFDANTVSFALSAPNCGAHMCAVFDSCGGGGTNADIWLKPTFKAKRRGIQETAPLQSQWFAAKRRSVTPDFDLGPQWSTVTVTGTFKDKDEEYKRQITVTKGRPIGNSELWKVEIVNDHLRIETR
jgi:hypothetical protein